MVSTVPDKVTVSPPSEVAPASEYDEPNSTVAGLSPIIVITGKTVSGGVAVSSLTFPAITTPAKISSCSMIESSNKVRSTSSSLSTPSSNSNLSSSSVFLSMSSSVDNDSSLSVTSATSPSFIAKVCMGNIARERAKIVKRNLIICVS